MIRAVLDTNVWVSSIRWRGTPFQLRVRAEQGAFVSVTSLAILVELTHVLRDYFGFSDEDAYEWYQRIGSLSEVVKPTQLLTHKLTA